MFKKYIKFIKVLVSVCAFCAASFSVVGRGEKAKTINEQQILKRADVVKQEILNNFNKYDKKDFQVEGFTNKIYYRKGLPILVYEHNKTKAKIVFQIFNDEIIEDCQDNYFFRAFEASDRGFVHLCEHCLGDISQMQKFASEMPESDFGFSTDEYGVKVYFSSKGDKKTYEADMLKYLRNPDTIDDKEKFEVEKNRVINEARNKNHLMSLKFGDSKYNVSGVPEQIQTIKHEEFKSFVQNYIHPSNLLVTRYISDANPLKIKEYLNLLNEEYLKYFSYKEINVKYYLKNDKVYNKKVKNISEKEQSSDGKNNEKFIIKIKFNFDSLNLNAKQRDALSLMLKDDSDLTRYINKMGYVPYITFGIFRDESPDYGYILLHTNDAELCKEEVIKQNSKKIIQFLKNRFKNFTDEEIMNSLSIADDFYQRYDDLFLNSKEHVFKHYLNYKHGDSFFDYVQKSFAKHNNIFSKNIFNINKDNEILEDENSVLKNIKGNLNVFDILEEKGPTQIDVYETVLLKEKDFEKLNKKNDLRSAFFAPIVVKDYGKNREVFNFISWLLETNLSNLIGYKKGLIYGGMNITGLKDSDFVGYFYENIFAEKDVTDYIYKNFDQIMAKLKIGEEGFEIGKGLYKKRLAYKLKKMIKYQIKYEYVNSILSFLKDKDISNLGEGFNLVQLKKLMRITRPYDNIEYLLLKDFKDLKKLNNDVNEFNRKYPYDGMKITNQMVKDYKELVFDNYYNLFKYSINFYKDCLEKIDGMQFDDFSKGVKSASLVKREELEKLNKKLKNAFDFDDK